jgi:hypothetical protein
MGRQYVPINNNTDYVGLRFIIKNENFGKFEAISAYNMMSKFKCKNNK